MTKLLALFFCTLIYGCHPCLAKPLTVAVVDSGISTPLYDYKLCPTGHKDFTGEGTIIDKSALKHGPNVATLITRNAGAADYCLIVVKIYGKKSGGTLAYLAALKYLAEEVHPDFLNLSISGETKLLGEVFVISRLLDQGTKIIAAAGNDKLNFEKSGCTIYPACADSRIIVVGNNGLCSTGNVGPQVDFMVDGCKQEGAGVVLSGTSQSAAIITGRLVRQQAKQGEIK